MNLNRTIKLVSGAIGAGGIAAAVLLTGLGDHGPSSDQVTLAENIPDPTLKPFPTDPLPDPTLKPFPTQSSAPSAPRHGSAGGTGLPGSTSHLPVIR